MQHTRLPKHIKDIIGKNERGPNCWNATQYFFNKNVGIKFCEQSEMIEWLQKNTFAIKNSKIKYKDIRCYWTFNHISLVHTAVNVNISNKNTAWFNKVGCMSDDGWTIFSTAEIDTVYLMPGIVVEHRRLFRLKSPHEIV